MYEAQRLSVVSAGRPSEGQSDSVEVDRTHVSIVSGVALQTPPKKHKKKPLTPNEAPAGTLEVHEPPKYMPGASKWPLEHTLGHQSPQKEALWAAFGGQDVEFGSFGAPKVLKMDPSGTPLGRQIGILEPVGSIVQPTVELVSCWVHFGGHFQASWDQMCFTVDSQMDERRTKTHAQNPLEIT